MSIHCKVVKLILKKAYFSRAERVVRGSEDNHLVPIIIFPVLKQSIEDAFFIFPSASLSYIGEGFFGFVRCAKEKIYAALF